MRAMRSITTLTTLGATAIALTFATGAVAQTGDSASPPDGSTSTSLSVSIGGSTQDTGVSDEDANSDDNKSDSEKLRWRTTSLTFNQSFSTQTVGIGSNPMSDNPMYEVALSFRPRFYILDGDTHQIYAGLRVDITRELTNSDNTTRRGETLFNNIPLDIAYGVKLYDEGDVSTALRIGARVVFPANKYTYRRGNWLRVGGSLALNQDFPLAGSDSTWFPTASLSGSLTYLKHINSYTTSTYSNFSRERIEIDGRTIAPSNQITGGSLVNHELTPLVSASLGITQSLSLSLGYTWVLQWAYPFDDIDLGITSGTVAPQRIRDPRINRVIPFVMAGLDYAVIPELGIGAGYYNQTNQIGPSGERRNPLWSPDAAFFIDITANLDQIYLTAAGKRTGSASANLAARQQARAGSIGIAR